MGMMQWWRFLRGTVEFRAEGGLCELFLEELRAQGVFLWDIHHTADGCTATCRAADYKRIRRPAAHTGTRVRHQRQRGAYVWWRPWRKRSGLLVGVMAAIGVYMLLMTRVWVIDLPPCDPLLALQIQACLDRNRVQHGTPVREIDTAAVSMDAVATVPQIHALSLYFEGCIARVDWRLQEEGVTLPDPSPANVVAATDGWIVNAQITAGQSMIKVGEAVVEGELLVCGAVETEQNTLLRHAAAKVIARTERVICVQVSRQEWQAAVRRRVEQPTLCIFSGRLPLYSTMVPPEGSTVTGETEWVEWLGTPLPIGIHRMVVTEWTDQAVTFSEETAQALARLRADAALAAQNAAANVIETAHEGQWDGDTYTLTVTYSCYEDIAKTVPLMIDRT